VILTREDFRKRIEYSLCQQFASEADVQAFCERAIAAGVGVACFNPVNVKQGASLIAGSGIEISANIGFPFGSHLTEVKVLETEMALADGATQIDMVIRVGALRSGDPEKVKDDIAAVVDAASGRTVKAIIETWVLTPGEIERASRIVEQAGAHMVKTTTGVRTQYLDMMRDRPRVGGIEGGSAGNRGPAKVKGAVVEEVRLIRSVLGPAMKVKASGGIYTLDDAISLLEAGADQLGVSRGEKIVGEFADRYGDQTELARAG
jgi:deoxyribose-phosphate aldolase